MATSLASSPARRDTNISTAVASDDQDAFYPTSPTSDFSEINDAESVPPTHKYRTLILCFDGTGKILCCLSAHPLVIASGQTECWRPFFSFRRSIWWWCQTPPSPCSFLSLSRFILEFQHCQFCFSLEKKWHFKATCLLSGMGSTSWQTCGRHAVCI